MKGEDAVTALKSKFKVTTDSALAAKLGMTVPSIQLWKNREVVTPRQLASLVYKATLASAKAFQADALQPLVEFFPIERVESRQRANYELFGVEDAEGLHPYRVGLRQQLAAHHGVYVFFDSRGQSIYVGKAKRQHLWKEMNLAFNRERGEVQRIKRVSHPIRRIEYRTSDEKARQIGDFVVPLHELARYFSAYQVADGMIDDLEAVLVRSFANDLLNKRMERFTRHRYGSG